MNSIFTLLDSYSNPKGFDLTTFIWWQERHPACKKSRTRNIPRGSSWKTFWVVGLMWSDLWNNRLVQREPSVAAAVSTHGQNQQTERTWQAGWHHSCWTARSGLTTVSSVHVHMLVLMTNNQASENCWKTQPNDVTSNTATLPKTTILRKSHVPS